MDQAEITASPKLRAIFGAVAAFMLALWGWSLIPPIENWDNPYEDGFSYVAVFYATITCLPVGLYLLVAAIGGRGRHIAHARTALFLGGGLLFLVVAFPIIQHIANTNGGKLFGVQIGFQFE
jgi:peptidoglycan/LPS O-acetylase OafA/YrhL